MEAYAQEKVEKLLRGDVKYTSSNLALNMMISKLQKRVATDPGCMESCIQEMDEFLSKYPIVAKVDLANIAML